MLPQCGSVQLDRAPCRTASTAGLLPVRRIACASSTSTSHGSSRQSRHHTQPQQRCMLRSARRSSCRCADSDEQRPGDNLPEPIAEIVQAVGEDAALFRLQDQSISAWGIFTMLLVGVLGALYAVDDMMRLCACMAVCIALVGVMVLDVSSRPQAAGSLVVD
jgi:hypothetical protein